MLYKKFATVKLDTFLRLAIICDLCFSISSLFIFRHYRTLSRVNEEPNSVGVMNQIHAALSPQAFGVIIPGGIVRTDFQPSDASGMKFALGLSGISGKDISTISEIVFFLLPGVSQPQDHGAIL